MYSWVQSQPADGYAAVHQRDSGISCSIAWLFPAPSSKQPSQPGRQALSQPQHGASSGPTIAAPQTLTRPSCSSPCTRVSMGGRQLFPPWHPQGQLRAAGTGQRGKEAPGSPYHQVQGGARWEDSCGRRGQL